VAEWRVVAAERPLYNDEWLDIRIADMEIPDGRHRAHRSIRRRERDNARGLALRAQLGINRQLAGWSAALQDQAG